jgi:hypothetical protein
MKNNGSGVPVSQASGTPWYGIKRGLSTSTSNSALNACASLGEKYSLISNEQFQRIARDIEQTSSNWSGGNINYGYLRYGGAGSAYDDLLPASTNDTEGCAGYVNVSCTGTWHESKRTHTLSNGNVIWDLAGNAHEYVKESPSELNLQNYITNLGDCSAWGSPLCSLTLNWDGWSSPSLSPSALAYVQSLFGPTTISSTTGWHDTNFGGFFYDPDDYTHIAITRGGGSASEFYLMGIYQTDAYLDAMADDNPYGFVVGFRCVYTP